MSPAEQAHRDLVLSLMIERQTNPWWTTKPRADADPEGVARLAELAAADREVTEGRARLEHVTEQARTLRAVS